MRRVRILIWILVVLALGGFAYLTLRPLPETMVSQGEVTGSTFGGPFTLVGSDSQPFSSTRLSGKPFAVFFGFTHCPDVCPTTLQRLVKLRDELGRGDDSLNIVFISVDPERDGPEQVAAYEDAFGGPVIALTGSPAQIQQVKKQYGIFAQKAPDGNGGYSVDHTASALLFDREGRFVSTISPKEPDQPALAKLKRIISA